MKMSFRIMQMQYNNVANTYNKKEMFCIYYLLVEFYFLLEHKIVNVVPCLKFVQFNVETQVLMSPKK